MNKGWLIDFNWFFSEYCKDMLSPTVSNQKCVHRKDIVELTLKDWYPTISLRWNHSEVNLSLPLKIDWYPTVGTWKHFFIPLQPWKIYFCRGLVTILSLTFVFCVHYCFVNSIKWRWFRFTLCVRTVTCVLGVFRFLTAFKFSSCSVHALGQLEFRTVFQYKISLLPHFTKISSSPLVRQIPSIKYYHICRMLLGGISVGCFYRWALT